MTKNDKRSEEVLREKEPPAHKIRRQSQRQIDEFVGVVDESSWYDDREITKFEKFKKKKK